MFILTTNPNKRFFGKWVISNKAQSLKKINKSKFASQFLCYWNAQNSKRSSTHGDVDLKILENLKATKVILHVTLHLKNVI